MGLAGLVGTLIAAGLVSAGVTVCSLLPRSVEEGLTYRFHAAWDEVLRVLEVFFETCGKQCHPIMRKVRQWSGRAAARAALPSPAAERGHPGACHPASAALGLGTGTCRAAGIPGQE